MIMDKIIFSIALSLMLQPSAVFGKETVKSGKFKTSVVELYTSEGCSSCPPADVFLSRLGKTSDADVIPLAFHVDYWNYIGWEDPFSQAKFTDRQRKAGRANKQSSIYTPEFLVDGVEARGGSKITRTIKNTLENLAEADITLHLLSFDQNKISTRVVVDNISYGGNDKPEVFVVVYENNLKNEINAGENKGKTLQHDYVVRSLSKARLVTEPNSFSFDFDVDSTWKRNALGITAIVRLQNSGKTLQAVKMAL